MDRLPVEMLQLILEYVLWDNPDRQLYRLLRTVSHTWKSAVEKSHSRIFKYWYNRCKKEIPEDHLQDIVETKYPLVAHPWQEFYWVDSGLLQVAKTVYNIWKNFPNVNADAITLNISWKEDNYINGNDPTQCFSSFNDKYFAISCHEDETWGTRIYRWDDPRQPIGQYDLLSDGIRFYTMKNETFIVLEYEDYERSDISEREIYISKYPIASLNFSSELISLGHIKRFSITENEIFFHIIPQNSTREIFVEHKILTERGLETNAIIKPPVALMRGVQDRWYTLRVKIRGSTLYVMQFSDAGMTLDKYKISRNCGKLTFTPEDDGHREFTSESPYYSDVLAHDQTEVKMAHPYLIDSKLVAEKFSPWLFKVFGYNLQSLAIHAGYVICGWYDKVRIFRQNNLIQCMEADDHVNLKSASLDIPWEIWTQVYRIEIIYIGVKAKIAVCYDEYAWLVDFY